MDRMLTTDEAARRLNVKPTTLYAYVSRGLLSSHRSADGRSSLFASSDLEELAARSRGGRQVEQRMATVTTGVTQLHSELGPMYRGRAAIELARTATFEQVAALLWQVGTDGDWGPPDVGPCPFPDTFDRLRWAVLACGASDPLRSDRRQEAVVRSARRIIAGMVDSVGTCPDDEAPDTPLAGRLAARLGGGRAADWSEVVDATLILMADHELATSTMAVRLAASVRSDVYDATLAGLAILAGPLHGGASRRAHEFLVSCETSGVQRAVNNELQERGMLPGFGHTVYTDGDPRFRPLLDLTERALRPEQRELLAELLLLVERQDMPRPNCDLALAAMSWGGDFPSDVGRTLFAIARVSGWTAHYLEELGERPLRFRARAVYAVDRSTID